jgi:hypothetical protein
MGAADKLDAGGFAGNCSRSRTLGVVEATAEGRLNAPSGDGIHR